VNFGGRFENVSSATLCRSETKLEKKVLHVDDDPAILKLVAHTLTARGYEVVSLTDPEVAVREIFQKAIRVVILDIDMPKKDGLTLLREIKQRDGGIQVVMLTGMVSMGTVLQATRFGAEEFVFKPIVDISDVTVAVDRCFAKINRWWHTLHEWMERKKETQNLWQCRDGNLLDLPIMR